MEYILNLKLELLLKKWLKVQLYAMNHRVKPHHISPMASLQYAMNLHKEYLFLHRQICLFWKHMDLIEVYTY